MSKDALTILDRYFDFDNKIEYLGSIVDELDKRINTVADGIRENVKQGSSSDKIEYLLVQKLTLEERKEQVSNNLAKTKESKQKAGNTELCGIKLGDLIGEISSLTDVSVQDMTILLDLYHGFVGDDEKIAELIEKRGNLLVICAGDKEMVYSGIHLFSDFSELQAGKTLLDSFSLQNSSLTDDDMGELENLILHFRLEVFDEDRFVTSDDDLDALDFYDDNKLLPQAVLNCIEKGKVYNSETHDDGFTYKMAK